MTLSLFLFYIIYISSLLNVNARRTAAKDISLSIPLQSQLPLVARAGKSYTWRFLPNTFSLEPSVPGKLIYTVAGNPRWLSFDHDSLLFSGTVPSSGIDTTFRVVVTVSVSGSNASLSDSFSLHVTSNPEPILQYPLASQLLNAHTTAKHVAVLSSAFIVNPSSALAPYFSSSEPWHQKSGVRVPPGWDFSIGFDGGTFSPWGVLYQATLADGKDLPEWIKWNPATFTFDGTAPILDFPRGLQPVIAMEIALRAVEPQFGTSSTNARDTFWLTVATHELKMRNATQGVQRNVTTLEETMIVLMDGPETDPWMGEFLWDASTVPINGIAGVDLDMTSSGLIYNSTSRSIAGMIFANSSQSEQTLSLPLRLVDTQNITLNTYLNLTKLPPFFQCPLSVNATSLPLRIHTTFSSDIMFDLGACINSEGHAALRRGDVELTTSIEPREESAWITFDQQRLMLNGRMGRDRITVNPSAMSTNSALSPIPHSTSQPVTQRDRNINHQFHIFRTEEVPTLVDSVLSDGPSELTGFWFKSTNINVTFMAHSMTSRTTSIFRIIYDLSDTATCNQTSPYPCSPNSADGNDPHDNNNSRRLAIILALVFSLLILVTFIAVLCYSKRDKYATWFVNALGKEKETKAEPPYVLHQDLSAEKAGGWARKSVHLHGQELENGVGGRIILLPGVEKPQESKFSPLEITQNRTQEGLSSGGYNHPVPYRVNRIDVPSINLPAPTAGDLTDSSGSRYEEASSENTNPHQTRENVGLEALSRLSNPSAKYSDEGDSPNDYFVSPLTRGQYASSANRPIGPSPPNSVATIPKQRFFAKLKGLTSPGMNDRRAKFDSTDREPPNSDASPTTPSSRLTLLSAIVPSVMKQASLASLLGFEERQSRSVHNNDSTSLRGTGGSSRGQSEKIAYDKKATIGKPRPLVPTLGTVLAKDYAEQIARAAASLEISSRHPSDDGGSGFIAGTAVIYSMESRPFSSSHVTSSKRSGVGVNDDTSSGSHLIVQYNPPLSNHRQGGGTLETNYQVAQSSTRDSSPSHPPAAYHAALTQNKYAPASVQPAASQSSSLTSSDGSTLGGKRNDQCEAGYHLGGPRQQSNEAPRRRLDFGRPRASVTDGEYPPQGKAAISWTHDAHRDCRDSRRASQVSLDSVGYVATAALAVRSPSAGAKLVPSPKPNHNIKDANFPNNSQYSSPSLDHSKSATQARLVQFVHEKHYDGGSSGEGGDERVAGLYSTYQGKRELSQKAVIGGALSEQWDESRGVPLTTMINSTSTNGSGSKLVEKVKLLREQSRILHDQQLNNATRTAALSRRTPSPTDHGFLDDPALSLGIHYMRSLGSTETITAPNSAPPDRFSSTDDSVSGVKEGERPVNPSPSRIRLRVSQTQHSFISWDINSHLGENQNAQLEAGLPDPPVTQETQFFDLSESSSGSTSTSQSSGMILPRAGQERILVGVNEPFNFHAPLKLAGLSPGQSSRVQILRMLGLSQQDNNDAKLWAELEDGRGLPDWLGFDSDEAEFWGVPEANTRGSSVPVKVYLQTGRDVEQVGRFIIEVVGR